jgi:hypothetical protein
MKILGVCLITALAAWLVPHQAQAAGVQCGKPKQYNTVSCFIDPALDPAALCVDGTLPAYWYRPGTGSGINEWVIWFGGGGACDSQADCAVYISKNGSPVLVSSNGFGPTSGKGITSAASSTNPALYNANMIYLHYCSADTWVGNQLGVGPYNPNDSSTWNFEGRRNAVAFIESLMEAYPGLNTASQIILGGDSSGGVGVTEVANDILPLLPAVPPKVLVNDAGFMFDIGQYDAAVPAPHIYPYTPDYFESDIQQRFVYWNAHGDSVCDALATTPTQHGNCYNTAYILQNGFITIPTFVGISQLDTSQVTQELCPTEYGYCPYYRTPNSKPGVWETAFAAQATVDVIGAGTAAAYSAYAADYFMHVMLNDNLAFTTPLPFPQGNLAPRDVFDAWLANTTGAPVSYIANSPGVGTYPSDE